MTHSTSVLFKQRPRLAAALVFIPPPRKAPSPPMPFMAFVSEHFGIYPVVREPVWVIPWCGRHQDSEVRKTAGFRGEGSYRVPK